VAAERYGRPQTGDDVWRAYRRMVRARRLWEWGGGELGTPGHQTYLAAVVGYNRAADASWDAAFRRQRGHPP
jgi:hypothetical protein